MIPRTRLEFDNPKIPQPASGPCLATLVREEILELSAGQPQHSMILRRVFQFRELLKICRFLGYLPCPFFPGILLFRKPSKTQRNSWFLKRTMVEKNGWNQPLEDCPKLTALLLRSGVLFQAHEAFAHVLNADNTFVHTFLSGITACLLAAPFPWCIVKAEVLPTSRESPTAVRRTRFRPIISNQGSLLRPKHNWLKNACKSVLSQIRV